MAGLVVGFTLMAATIVYAWVAFHRRNQVLARIEARGSMTIHVPAMTTTVSGCGCQQTTMNGIVVAATCCEAHGQLLAAAPGRRT